jgi:hypothetical protein
VLNEPESLILQHICGEACLHKRLSHWLAASTSITTTPESVNA